MKAVAATSTKRSVRFNEFAEPSHARLTRAEGPILGTNPLPDDSTLYVTRSTKRPRDNWSINTNQVDPFLLAQVAPKDTITAHCELDFLGYSDSTGSIILTQTSGDMVSMIGEFEHLEPGLHALKIHEYGDVEYGCDSTGPVFNPMGEERGHSHDDIHRRRMGDIEHVQARFDTMAEYKNRDQYATMWGPNSILGRSLVLYEREDDHDQTEQEARIGADGRPVEERRREGEGHAIACCVIGRMEIQPEPKEEKRAVSGSKSSDFGGQFDNRNFGGFNSDRPEQFKNFGFGFWVSQKK